jgi:restriction system protein
MTSSGTIGAVGYGFGYVFTLWPLIVLSPLRWKRENVLAGMIIAWTLLLSGWLFAGAVSPRPLVALIPEPLNTYLFFLTGMALLIWGLLREMRRQRFLQAVAGRDRSTAQVLDMSTRQFEDMTIELYRSLGYRAKRIGGGILLRGRKGGCWLVQCRGWHGPVGEDVVRQFWDEVQTHEVDGGILITTGIYSRQARDWAEGKHLSLMEGEEFLDAWRRARAD